VSKSSRSNIARAKTAIHAMVPCHKADHRHEWRQC
jgi:hypothetical protein